MGAIDRVMYFKNIFPGGDNNFFSRFELLIPAFFFAAALLLISSCSRQPAYPPAVQEGSNLIIDVATITPEVPKFYTYHYQGKAVNFFALKIDGKVNSFLDACASCYAHRQGYRYEDGCVTCRDCGARFSIYKLEKGLGSCYPIKIEGRMENGKYLIPVKTLEALAGKF